MNIGINYFEGSLLNENSQEENFDYKIKNCCRDTLTYNSYNNTDTYSTKSNESQTFHSRNAYEPNNVKNIVSIEYKYPEHIIKIPNNFEEILRKYKGAPVNFKESIGNILQEIKKNDMNKILLSNYMEELNNLLVSPGLLSPDIEKEFKEIQKSINNKKIKKSILQQNIHNFIEKNAIIFDIKKFNEIIQNQKVLQNSEIVLFIGKPGAGKSASILYLCGCELKKISKEKYVLENNPLCIQNINNIQIANNVDSQAKTINLIDISTEQLSKLLNKRMSRPLTFCESHILSGPSDLETKFANGKSFIDNLKACKSLKIIYLISKNDTKNITEFYVEVAQNLSTFIPNFNEEILDSVLFLFTKFTQKSFVKLKRNFSKKFDSIGKKEKINEKEMLIINRILQQIQNEDFESFIDLANKQTRLPIITAILRMNSLKKQKIEQAFDYSVSDTLKVLVKKVDFLKKQALYALKIQNKFDFPLLLDVFNQIDLLQKAIYLENSKEFKLILDEFFTEIYKKADDYFFDQSKMFEKSLTLILDEENLITFRNTYENALIFNKIYEKHFPNRPKLERFYPFIEIINALIKKFKIIMKDFDLDNKKICEYFMSIILLKRKFLDYSEPGTFEEIDDMYFLKQISNYLNDLNRESVVHLEFNEFDAFFNNINKISKISEFLDQTVNKIPNYIESLKEKIEIKFQSFLNDTHCILTKMLIFMEEKNDEDTIINIFKILKDLKSESNICNDLKRNVTKNFLNEIYHCFTDFYFKINEEIAKNNSSEMSQDMKKEMKYFENRMNQLFFLEKHLNSKIIQNIYSAIKKQINSRFLQIKKFLIEKCHFSNPPLNKFELKKIARFFIYFNKLTSAEVFQEIIDTRLLVDNIQAEICDIFLEELPNKLQTYEKWDIDPSQSIKNYLIAYSHIINLGNSFMDVFPELNSKIEFILKKLKKSSI